MRCLLVRIVRALRSLFALHGVLCLVGISFIAMALGLAQRSCGLQLCWAAGGITVLGLHFECEFVFGCRRSAFMFMLTWPMLQYIYVTIFCY